MKNYLQNFPVTIEQAVSWGDMDAHRHVNNIHYFRYIENARIAYYERIGKYELEHETGISFVLAKTTCIYKAPLKYPDTVSVGARIGEVPDDRVVMHYCIVSQDKNRIAAEAEATLVSFDHKNKKRVPLPKVLKDRIAEVEGLP